MSQKDQNAWGPIDPAERLLDAFLKYELSYPVLSWKREKVQSQFLHLGRESPPGSGSLSQVVALDKVGQSSTQEEVHSAVGTSPAA